MPSASLVKEAHANFETTIVTGNYNGVFATASDGTKVAMPTLITSEIDGTEVSNGTTDIAFTLNGQSTPVVFRPSEVTTGADTETIISDLKAAYSYSGIDGNIALKTPIADVLSMTETDANDQARFESGYLNKGSSLTLNSNTSSPATRIVEGYSKFIQGSGTLELRGLEVDSAGNAYVIGKFSHPTDFGFGEETPVGSNDVFLVKYDSDGNVLNAKVFGGADDDNIQGGIKVDSSGNIYLTGYSRSTSFTKGISMTNGGHYGWNAYLIKISPDFSTVAGKMYGGNSHEYIYKGIDVDSSGYIYLYGSTSSSYIEDNQGNRILNKYSSMLGSKTFLLKISSDLSSATGKMYGSDVSGTGPGIGDIIVDDSGNIYIASSFNCISFVDELGNTVLTRPGITTNTNVMLLKLAPDFTVLNSAYYLGSSVETYGGFDIDSSGNVYLYGTTNSSSISDGTNTIVTRTVMLGYKDIYLLKVSSDFSTVEGRIYGGDGNEVNSGGVEVDDSGNIYLYGYTLSQDFNVGIDIPDRGRTDADLFLIKVSSDLNTASGTFYGGTGNEINWYSAPHVNSDGETYIAGNYTSESWNIEGLAELTNPGGQYNGFVTKFKVIQ